MVKNDRVKKNVFLKIFIEMLKKTY